jgi:protein-tyrosine phosphatase
MCTNNKVTTFNLATTVENVEKTQKTSQYTKQMPSITVLISNSPLSHTLRQFVLLLLSKNVTDVFCFCELHYDPSIFKEHNIRFNHLQFADGSSPTIEIINKFNILLNDIYDKNESPVINLHCQSGMGRAPTMLVYLMMSRYKWTGIDAVTHIRSLIPHAFNNMQLKWALNAKIKQYKFKIKKTNNDNKMCIIS